jgi:hypothetical protein
MPDLGSQRSVLAKMGRKVPKTLHKRLMLADKPFAQCVIPCIQYVTIGQDDP